MIKIFKILFVVITFQFAIISCYADSDGNNTLSGKDEAEVKDCFEKLNRGIFAFNNGLDKALFKPIATGYRKLPSPIRSGTGNAINNLSNLVTIPNNILQGDINSAVNNSFRFVIK